MLPVDLSVGLPCEQASKFDRPRAWLVEYSNHAAVFLDRARAEQAARDLHGVITPLYLRPLQGVA